MNKDLQSIVEKTLRAIPETRDSDNKLIYAVMRHYGIEKDTTFASVMKSIIDGKLPPFASITRAKRKVVEKFPELDCCAKVRADRDALEEFYKDYARS